MIPSRQLHSVKPLGVVKNYRKLWLSSSYIRIIGCCTSVTDSVEEAKTNGLKPNKERVCLKPVEKPVQGLTRAVELHMGDLEGQDRPDPISTMVGPSGTGNLRLTSFQQVRSKYSFTRKTQPSPLSYLY
ncbi:hypothetical protein AtNW77_MTg0322661 (mitochondrion) [Arabidopsis thaliana]|uniref:Uncharacterized protein n=1 Tax=Arabidopsis thaliana TaxID=3702 RepID=F4INF6_ARATH|nr:uncharacterized protein AT2G07835 [Arabidopsis thaliana]AEC06125.1 hypothetical protein AT2G07835 [Arabidopsis thaliana]|eukprot:NP_001118290.2 hypothetical protein AT2G07835 [Arabidopsis thaliana]